MSQNWGERGDVLSGPLVGIGTQRLAPPSGFEAIIATFGDIRAYLRSDHSLDPAWQREMLATANLPFALPLSWDRSQQVDRITCHKLLQQVFEDVFQNLHLAGLRQQLTSFGGGFSFRPQRMATKLSTHAWGIAIDLNPEGNQQGTTGNMHPDIVSVFRQAGFTWGGDWQGSVRDPMHFQYCSGY